MRIKWEMSIGYPTAKKRGYLTLDKEEYESMTREEIDELVWEQATQSVDISWKVDE